ncbi:hypothetical protein EDD18DRAFT_1198669 [Armillaria luteobubalina]|uniref:Hydrophobin n=1 Tax=Armillaria luteobubalina TaxID=153913 RepID=A0AA39PI91_9AGAR|nr:hypothetical protein EDD18DRAFT_1198669 [Armillaria luteobubalina]
MFIILRPLLLLATAAFAVASTPTQRCSGYNQLVQCCENVVIANKATLDVDAGPLDPSKLVGFGCSLPRIVIAQSALRSCAAVLIYRDIHRSKLHYGCNLTSRLVRYHPEQGVIYMIASSNDCFLLSEKHDNKTTV